MKILTANIAHGLRFGEFSTVGESSIRTLAEELNADVVCLQEVDFKKERSSDIDQVEVLRVNGKFSAARFFPALIGEPGIRSAFRMPTTAELHEPPADAYGIGFLSRFPIVEVKILQMSGSRLSLPMPFMIDNQTRWRAIPDEPRVAARVTLETPLGRIDVVTTHLSFIPSRAIFQLLTIKQLKRNLPMILAGDLNLSPKVSQRIMSFRHAIVTPTYPKPQPRLQLDHILVSDELHSNQASRKEFTISDHFALWADITKK